MAQATLKLSGSGIRELFQRFFPYTLRVKRAAATSALLVLMQPVLTVALLWIGKELVDDVLIAGRTESLVFLAAVYAACISGKIALDYFTQCIEAAVVQDITQSLRVDLYGHIMGLAPGSLGSESTGSLLTRLQGDAEQAEYLVFTAPIGIVADVAAVVFFVGSLLVLSWQLTLFTLLALPGIVWASLRTAPPIRRAARLSRRAEALWISHAEERFEAAPAIAAYAAEAHAVALFNIRARRARDREVGTTVLMARQSLLIEIAAAFGGMVVLGAGAYLVSTGLMTVGALVAFLGALASTLAPVRALAKATGRLQSAAAGAQRVADILDRPSRVSERTDARPLARAGGRIEFRDVAFSYPGDEPVLHGVSFSIEPGETVALVGPSGSGKSSLVRLLLRFYDPTRGQILIGGEDIRDVTLASLRTAMSTVFQDPYILSGSIASNIRFGGSGFSAGRIAGAARAAAVDRFVDIPAGELAGAAGPRGSLLSGGQRQRIALARAIAKEASILVLDEATGAVDSETEDFIQDALERIVGTRTTVLVAHRLSSVRRADRILVLDQGRIVEFGTPDKLLSTSSRARALFATQARAIEEAA